MSNNNGWLAGIAVSNPAGGMCLLCVVQLEALATGRSVIQGSPTEYVCECVTEFSQTQQ